jgi:hypothetical protein
VLLTGAFEPLDERRAQQIGCDGVLVKPFEPQLVISRVRELLDRSTAPPPESPRPSEQRPVAAPARSGAEDLPLATTAPRESARETGGPAGGKDLDDYFDQLDEAFASLETGGAKPSRPAAGRRDEAAEEAPVSAGTGFQTAPVEAAHDFGEWDLDALGHGSAGPGAAPASPSPEAGGVEPTARVSVPEPAVADWMSVPEPMPRVSPPPAAPAPRRPDVPAAPAPVSSAPTMPVVPDRVEAAPLANAFAAFLAAEQGVPSAGGVESWAVQPQPEVTDELIDDLARRVLERLTDRVIREAVSDAVGGVAERLVREEIERIKSNA